MRSRTRVVMVLLATVLAALAAVGVASVDMLHRHLVNGVDDQLRAFANEAVRAWQDAKMLGGQVDRSGVTATGEVPGLPSEFVVQLRHSNGGLALQRRSELRRGEPGPNIPADPQWFAAHADKPVTIDGQWRVLVTPAPGGEGSLVVAMDLADVNGTVSLLIKIEVIAGVLVALALTGVAVSVVRSEAAFAARSRSEARMRQFVADAGHELRTPLTVIRGFADYYRQRQGNGSGELDRMVGHVQRTATQMSALVDDLLLLARLDADRPLERRPVDLLELAGDAVRDARLVDPSRTIQFSFGTDTAFIVSGDEARLRQVLGNLLANALAHTPPGTGVDVRVAKVGAASAAIEVADHGPGMPDEQVRRVFERFYRADPSRTGAGTGLGLSIVESIVHAHGGTVTVRSVVGEGTVFRVVLPLADA